MRQIRFLAFCLSALIIGTSAPAHAFCMIVDKTYAKDGWKSGDPRQMTVADEYRTVDYVLIGKVVGLRRLDIHDGEWFEATSYRVELVKAYKGSPPNNLNIFSENSTARFDMDVGKTYLLFVSHLHRLYFVDNCGWSDEIRPAAKTLRELDHRSEFSKRPLHCWKGNKIGCVPDLRTYPGGERPKNKI